MGDAEKGSQHHPDSIPELGEDAATVIGLSSPPPAMTEEEQQELQEELVKVEDEILTLSQVLGAKEKHMADIKKQLGITPLDELKHNFTKTWQDVTTSIAYRRTSETLSQAGVKATAAFSNVGSVITKKLENVRNAPTFKSFEEKVETLKTKMSPSASTSVTAEQDVDVLPTETLTSQPDDSAPKEN